MTVRPTQLWRATPDGPLPFRVSISGRSERACRQAEADVRDWFRLPMDEEERRAVFARLWARA